MARDLRPPKTAGIVTPDLPRPPAGMPATADPGFPLAGWDAPAWTSSPVAQIAIALSRAIEQLAAHIQESGVDQSALARLKNVQAALSAVLRRGFADLNDGAVTQLYRLCTLTHRTLLGIPRQEKPRGWDARLFTVHGDFTLLLERLAARRKHDTAVAPPDLSARRVDALVERLSDLAGEIRALDPHERSQLRLLASEILAQAFGSAGAAAAPTGTVRESIPRGARELWADRQAFAGETALGFLQRVYGSSLGSMRLADIAAIDQPLYQALQTWRRRNAPPANLKAFFSRERRSRADIDAELKKHRIKKPEDAFARFPDDKATAQRLYQAARARQTR